MERTLIMIKPDAVQRGLIGEIVGRFEHRGFKIIGLKMIRLDEALARRLYADHEGKPFFPGLMQFITSSPVVVMVVEGKNAIQAVRCTLGTTNPVTADAGTIRADLALETERNLVHGSDSPASAARETALLFQESELLSWARDTDHWVSIQAWRSA